MEIYTDNNNLLAEGRNSTSVLDKQINMYLV